MSNICLTIAIRSPEFDDTYLILSKDLPDFNLLAECLCDVELEPFFNGVMQDLAENYVNPVTAIVNAITADATLKKELLRILMHISSLFLNEDNNPETKYLLASISLLCRGAQDEKLFVAFSPYDTDKGIKYTMHTS